MTEVHHGLEGVVAFETQIAEPDKEGSALRYRGVDIEDIVGRVPFENVWGLLIDGTYTPRPAARRAVQPAGPHRRRPGRRAGRGRDARAGVRLRPDLRHHRRAGPRGPRPGRRDGAVVRRPVGPRPRPAGRPAARGRRGPDPRRAVHDPLEGRGRPGAREGDRRLLELRRRARHERLHVHRPGDHQHRRRRGGRVLRRDRRDERPAARRRPVAGARHDRGGREVRRRRGLRQGAARLRRAADGLRAPRLPRRGPARPGAASYGARARRAALRGRRGAREGRAGRAPRAPSRPGARDQRGVLGGDRPRLRRGAGATCSPRCSPVPAPAAGRRTSSSRRPPAG